MDRQQFLISTLDQIEELAQQPAFISQTFQVRARAIHEEFGGGSAPSIQFTFQPEKMWNYCNFLFGESVLLLNENIGERKQLLRYVKTAAETFEFLANLM